MSKTDSAAHAQGHSHALLKTLSMENCLALFRLSTDGIYILDISGKVIEANDALCAMLGYSYDEIVRLNIAQFDAGYHDAIELSAWLKRQFEQTVRSLSESKHRSKEGALFYVEISSACFEWEGQRVLFCSARDITQRKLEEQKLLQAVIRAESGSRIKSNFLAHMSHEIRTPMNSILGMAEMLAETELTDEQRKYVGIFQNAGKALLELINDILDISKVEAGQMKLDKSDFAVDELLTQLLELKNVLAREKGLGLLLELKPGVPSLVHGDANRLKQCLMNLLSNAIKFSSQGEIKVTVETIADRVDMLRFSVADQGIGIHEDKLTTIFTPFSQADSSISRRFGGTGLGLSITRHLVGLMGGEIGVESCEGKGSTFYFTVNLPAAQCVDTRIEPGITAPLPLADSTPEGLTILLAEDNHDNVVLIEAYLRRSPHRLDLAENGLIAVEKFRNNRYDLILMDVQMPEMDGYQASAEIRRIEKAEGRPPTLIIAQTAHAFREDEQRSLDAGCDRHITKPIRKSFLLELLQSIQQAKVSGLMTALPEQPGTQQDTVVTIQDQDILALIPDYLLRRRQEIGVLKEAITRRDFARLRSLGHKMKGTGGSYGLDRIYEIGSRIENCAKAQDILAIEQEVAHLADYLERVKIVGNEIHS